MNHTQELGTAPIGPLLRKQAIPAAIGILTLSINGIIDNIFVGQYVGVEGIGAITVVLPITFLIASIGMSIGVGGASFISRALGQAATGKASHTFGNQIVLTGLFSMLFVPLGYFLQEGILGLFGGRGSILPLAQTYFNILLPAIPFLAFAMMANNVIRAEGRPKFSMGVMIIPAVMNILLDAVFVMLLDWGMAGAAWATTLSYAGSALYAGSFFLRGQSGLELRRRHLILDKGICLEIFSIGSVTLARQGTVSVLAIVLNNALFAYGGEVALSIWGIINRMMMFAAFPVFGVTQGFLPIAGYNYGAEKWSRVREVIRKSIQYGTAISLLVFVGIMLFTPGIISIFTNEPQIIRQATPAMRWVFLLTPSLTLQLIGAAYYQAIGQARLAMLLTLAKQGIFLVPLIWLLPHIWGIQGIWWAFPIADGLTAMANYLALRHGLARLATQGKATLPQDSDSGFGS